MKNLKLIHYHDAGAYSLLYSPARRATWKLRNHYNDVIMRMMASQNTSLAIVSSTVYSGADKKKSKLPVTGLCEGNSPVTGEFPVRRASNAENVSIWWRHHAYCCHTLQFCQSNFTSVGQAYKNDKPYLFLPNYHHNHVVGSWWIQGTWK